MGAQSVHARGAGDQSFHSYYPGYKEDAGLCARDDYIIMSFFREFYIEVYSLALLQSFAIINVYNASDEP